MQRSDHLKYQELLDDIIKVKQNTYLVLLNAFHEGIKEELEKHPYEQAKGLIFKALWQYLESLAPDQYLLSYPQFIEIIPLQVIIGQYLPSGSLKQDISDNKKEMLFESVRLFYDLHNVYLLLRQQQTGFLIASQVVEEAAGIKREALELTEKLQQYQKTLHEYSTDEYGLLTYSNFYVGVAKLASLLKLENIPAGLLAYANNEVAPVFSRIISLALKMHKGTVANALNQYDAEAGQSRYADYRFELKAYANNLLEARQQLMHMIELMHQRYDKFRPQLAKSNASLQRLDQREANINTCLELAQKIKAYPIAKNIIATCKKQSFYMKGVSEGVALLAHKNSWHEAAEKISLLLGGCTAKIQDYANSFSEDYVKMNIKAMGRAKLDLLREYADLSWFAPALLLWQQSAQVLKGQVTLIKQRTKESKCFFFCLFERKPEPIFRHNYLNLRIPEDIERETAEMVADMEGYERAENMDCTIYR